MGVFEKLKNALFEVEYVEVDEPDKKEKKKKEKRKEEVVEEEKPIAKKIVLPGKREEKIEELEEEELKDDNFESRPMDETIKEENHHEFKFMDDNDFKPDADPEIVEVLEKEEYEPVNRPINAREVQEEKVEEPYTASIDSRPYSYNVPHERESKPYGMDNTYKVPVHEYGTYERKEERTTFKPSPIISPIYGILDKNYKKDDVVQKKEVRLTSGYTRGSMNVDDVRDKAYGRKEETKTEVLEEKPSTKFEEEVEEDENLLIDLNDEKKPEVKEITVGDAVEYFQDLGLEYNVDYVDASKEKPAPKKQEESIEEDIKEEIEKEEPVKKTEPKKEEKKIVKKEEKVEEKLEEELEDELEEKKDYEVKEESKATPTLDDDDNLFDLIDSMYKEND